MWQIEKQFHVRLGGSTFIDTPHLVTYKEAPLFVIRRSDSDGLLEIDLDIFDFQGQRAATIRRGLIAQGDQENYELFEGEYRFTVTEKKSGRILCEIRNRSEAAPAELDVWLRLYTSDGFLFDATPDEITLGINTFHGNTYVGCGVAIKIIDVNSLELCSAS